jgi:hypothetical protein
MKLDEAQVNELQGGRAGKRLDTSPSNPRAMGQLEHLQVVLGVDIHQDASQKIIGDPRGEILIDFTKIQCLNLVAHDHLARRRRQTCSRWIQRNAKDGFLDRQKKRTHACHCSFGHVHAM